MSKFKPGVRVVITAVPERAKAYVKPGYIATVLDPLVIVPVGHTLLEDCGIVAIEIANIAGNPWAFWWSESDLVLLQ